MKIRLGDPVRVGVVGLGRFGRLHALTLAGLAESRLVAVVARREDSLNALKAELPGVPGWTDLDQAIRESDADAWVVACSTASHVNVTKTLLAAEKPVLLEKPVSENLTEAMTLQSFVKPDSSNLMMGHILLFNSEFQCLLDEVRRRPSLSYIDCVRHRPASVIKMFPGENPLHAAMIHDLYSVQVMMNRMEPDFFQACYHRTLSGEIDVAVAQLRWPCGTLASMTASYLTPAGMAPRGFDRMEVFGSGWSARILPNPRPVETWSEQAEWPAALEIRTGQFGATGMLAEELRCFCRVVRGEQQVPLGATYTDAMQVQKWMDQLTSSAEAT